MFERTLSLCRRLIGKPGALVERGNAALQEERRLWVRHDADWRTEVRLACTDWPERISAQVRNISVGGANLITERSLAPGRILSLELPGADEQQVVLACVVRVEPLAGGQWSIGCTFSRELAPADLSRFGVHGTVLDPTEQRQADRHACELRATYQRIGEDDDRCYSAQVLNVSVSGVGLLLTEAVEIGSLVNLHLANAEGVTLRTILACVVHTTCRNNGELVVGCNFIRELAEDELEALL